MKKAPRATYYLHRWEVGSHHRGDRRMVSKVERCLTDEEIDAMRKENEMLGLDSDPDEVEKLRAAEITRKYYFNVPDFCRNEKSGRAGKFKKVIHSNAPENVYFENKRIGIMGRADEMAKHGYIDAIIGESTLKTFWVFVPRENSWLEFSVAPTMDTLYLSIIRQAARRGETWIVKN